MDLDDKTMDARHYKFKCKQRLIDIVLNLNDSVLLSHIRTLEEMEDDPESLEQLYFTKRPSLFSVFIDKFFRFSKPSFKRLRIQTIEEMENVKLIMIKHLFEKLI
mmetsp:Transcript_46631/g.34210  ORF Transcript_46631/g.34210 Transcript_46631/m.34210 type:complete len:105 (+) Transcript_46631:131-445(+)